MARIWRQNAVSVKVSVTFKTDAAPAGQHLFQMDYYFFRRFNA